MEERERRGGREGGMDTHIHTNNTQRLGFDCNERGLLAVTSSGGRWLEWEGEKGKEGGRNRGREGNWGGIDRHTDAPKIWCSQLQDQ